jgi:hypothetical protein
MRMLHLISYLIVGVSSQNKALNAAVPIKIEMILLQRRRGEMDTGEVKSFDNPHNIQSSN